MKYLKWRAENEALILKMANDGLPYAEIAVAMECSKQAIQIQLTRLGYSRPPDQRRTQAPFGYRDAKWPTKTWFGPKHTKPDFAAAGGGE
jgi:hypothetical protein